MSTSSLSSMTSLPEDALVAMSAERLVEHAAMLQRQLQRLERENKQLKSTCTTLRALADQDDVVLSDVICKRIELLETDLHLLEPGHHDVGRLQVQIDQLKQDKVALENQLEQESESIVLRLSQEKRNLEAEAAKLKAELSKASPEHAQAMLHHMAEEVIRLRSLLTSSGRASDDVQVDELQEVAGLQNANLKLRRKVHQLKERVATLERSQAETENSFEIDDERLFNISRSESPMLIHGPHGVSSTSLLASTSPLGLPLSTSPSSTWRHQALMTRPRSGSNASSVSSRSGTLPYALSSHRESLGQSDQ
eukprot:m.23222 g.23222  ORF g.23222 m.23222 type:complete len:309 (+) comp11351_c0_seq1:116-1042(+)